MTATPRPGSASINGGPFLHCRFVLDGTDMLIDWSVDVAPDEVPPMGHATVEIVICDGVSVFGDMLITDVNVRQPGGISVSAYGSGSLRGAR